jgi:16S rRNA (guanine527-N7)-methyltransferase
VSDPGQRQRTTLENLGERYRLTAVQLQQLGALLEVLADDPRAPTSPLAAETALEVHVADSLAALDLDLLAPARRFADLGAGAGFPGLVLASALPNASFSLLESNARKCAFITDLAGQMNLANATAVWARAEAWDEGRDVHDVVTARALAPQPVVLEYAAPLLRVGGVLVDWRGRRIDAEELAADNAAAVLGVRRVEVRAVTPFVGAREHHLHVFVKDGPTPGRFPRRVGMARKRPLG